MDCTAAEIVEPLDRADWGLKVATPEMKEEVRRQFLSYPPVTRGREVPVDAMNSPLCLDYAAKEYLLHSQNALMELFTG